MFFGSTAAALMGHFTPISRLPAKHAMRTAWVHSGALLAPLCIHGDVMAHFAGRCEIGVKFPTRAASVDPKSTQLTPLTILLMDKSLHDLVERKHELHRGKMTPNSSVSLRDDVCTNRVGGDREGKKKRKNCQNGRPGRQEPPPEH